MTKRQFERFKRQFKKHQARFNLGEYTVTFAKKKFNDRWAEIDADPEGCVAIVNVADNNDWKDEMIDIVAMHECIHLLLARLTDMGSRRFISEDDLGNENERVTCILEKLLTP